MLGRRRLVLGRRRLGRRRRRLAAVLQHLLEPGDHPLRGDVLRIDGQRPARQFERPDLVAAVERDARQPDDRDGVAGICRGHLPVEGLGPVEQPDGQRPLGLEQQLDHRSSVSMA